MFIHLKDFKRLLKEAYTGVGLCVARRGDDVLFGGTGSEQQTTAETRTDASGCRWIYEYPGRY